MNAIVRVEDTTAQRRHVRLEVAGRTVSRGGFVDLLQHDADVRHALSQAIVAVPHEAVFLETPPTSRATLDAPWECVLVDAPALAGITPDRQPFRAELTRVGSAPVARFSNLGDDALLVVPRWLTDDDRAYAHLAAFVRGAPEDQVDRLWREVGIGMANRFVEVPDAPTWLSTSGLGVHWLHVRLDSEPKYYVHAPYRETA